MRRQCDGTYNAPRQLPLRDLRSKHIRPWHETRQPYANNTITNPDPKALAYLSHFPTPNYTSPIPGNFYNWSGTNTAGIDNNNYSARLDYSLTAKDSRVFSLLARLRQPPLEGGLVPELALGNGPVHTTNTYQVHWVHAFGATSHQRIQFQH